MSQYNWNATDYEKNSNNQKTWAAELISKLKLKGDERILDIGCGDGKVAVELAKLVPQGSVVGVDNSSEMISLAMAKYKPQGFKNLSFAQADARNLDYKNEFDVAFSNAALHWVKDHLSVLRGVNKSLHKEGRILFQMGGKGNASEILSIFYELVKEQKWNKYFDDFEFPYGFYSPEEYKKWLSETGFKTLRVELLTKDMVHDNPGSLAGWIRTTWLPYTERVPSNERDWFIDELVRLYIKKYPLDDMGRAHVKMVRLEVEAKKETSIN
jgi:trans-aconitate methyltransferase